MARETKIRASAQDVLAALDGAHHTVGGIDFWIGNAQGANLAYAPGDTYCNQPQLKALVARMVEDGMLSRLSGAELINLGVSYDVRPKSSYYLTPGHVVELAKAKADRAEATLMEAARKWAVEILTSRYRAEFDDLVKSRRADPEFDGFAR